MLFIVNVTIFYIYDLVLIQMMRVPFKQRAIKIIHQKCVLSSKLSNLWIDLLVD